MSRRFGSPHSKMVQALTILSALQLFSDGVPRADGSGEPFGVIPRGLAEEAARARASVGTPQNTREFDSRPLVPALSQLNPTLAPSPQNMASSHGNITNGPISNQHDAQKPEMEQCDGDRGFYRYERMPDAQRAHSASNSDLVQLSEMPGDVLFKCLGYCLKDQTPSKNRALHDCAAMGFNAGKLLTSFPVQRIRFSESKCSFIMPDNSIQGGNEPQYQHAEGHVHYRKVCYSGGDSVHSGGGQDCPDRLYVMERHMAKRFLPKDFKKVDANTFVKCQEICLNQQLEDPLQATDICRAGTFNHRTQECYLSSYTRRTASARDFKDDREFDYFENTCLTDERRCKNRKLIFTKEEGYELSAYDSLVYPNKTIQQCKDMCAHHKSINCRSVEYKRSSSSCILSEEDSTSKSHRRRPSSDTDLLELKCLGNEKALNQNSGANEDRQQLSDRNKDGIPIAFQIYRERRLEPNIRFPPQYKEFPNIDLSTCLNNCLTDQFFECHSVEYLHSKRACRYSKLRQTDGNLIFDPQVHYFRNMMYDSSSSSVNSINNIPGRFRPFYDNVLTSSTDRRFSSFNSNSQSNRFGQGNRIGNDDRFFGSQSGTNFGNRDQFFNSGSRFPSSNNAGNRFGGAFNRFPERELPIGTTGTGVITGEQHFSGGRTGGSFSVGNRFDDRRGGFQSSGVDFNRGQTSPGTGGFSSGSSGSNFGTTGTSGTGSSGAGPSHFGFGGSGSSFQSGSQFGGSSGFGSSGFGSSGFGSSGFGSSGLGSSGFGSSGFGSSGSFGSGFGSTAFGTDDRFGSADRFGAGGSFGTGTGFDDSRGGLAGVSQICNPDGSMEFMMRTGEPFYGRIYALGYYDRCYYRGGGSTANMLKLSPPRGFPDCGSIGYGGDTTSNIVVVQFANGVETALDKRYNLTCTTVGPGDTVVTSEYISSGMGAPTPIEYLPERSHMSANVRLLILYNGRPTTTVAVGDPLTFRLEPLSGRGMVSDIFATNVVARDPITGRAVELIDSRGCPVQLQVFPALGKSRSGDGLEARFSAFKIPESTVLVFEAKVRMCRSLCEPAICTVGPGRMEVMSFGRRRRSLEDNAMDINETSAEYNDTETLYSDTREGQNMDGQLYENYEDYNGDYQEVKQSVPQYENTQEGEKEYDEDFDEEEEEEANVNEVIRVYLNEEEAEAFREVESAPLISEMCIDPSEYYSLLGCLLVVASCLCVSLIVLGIHCRKQRKIDEKNKIANTTNPSQMTRSAFPGTRPRTITQPARYFPPCDEVSSIDIETSRSVHTRHGFSDPSEPIYTDPTLFEKPDKSSSGSSSKEGLVL